MKYIAKSKFVKYKVKIKLLSDVMTSKGSVNSHWLILVIHY